MEKIDRREAIKRTTLIMGGALSTPLVTALLSGCTTDHSEDWEPSVLRRVQVQVAADLAEVILPKTDTPGAKDAQVERFVDSMVSEWLSTEDASLVRQFLDQLYEDGFSNQSFEEQSLRTTQLIKDEKGKEFFLTFKQMVLLGFFTSKIGATEVLQYIEIPGVYIGCVSLEEVGGKTWAT